MIWLYARMNAEPGLLQRLLEPFSVMSLAPKLLQLRPSGDRCSFVALAIENLEPERAKLIGVRLSQVPGIAQVRVSHEGLRHIVGDR
jgi:hypothetical protein